MTEKAHPATEQHGTVDGVRVCGPTRSLAAHRAWPNPIGECTLCLKRAAERKARRQSRMKSIAGVLRELADRLEGI